METSAAILPARLARLPGLPASSTDGHLGSHPSSGSCPPSRSSGQLRRWRPRQLSFQRILPAFQAFRPAPAMETSAAGDPAHPGHRSGLPASSGDEDLGGHPSSASWAPRRPPGQPVRWRPRRPVTVLTTVLITRRTHELSSRAASSRPPAFQASRPAPAIETSAALLPAAPARLPGLPSSRSDGDLGSSPSGASWAPSRPPGQLHRRTPRQLSFRRILGAFQAFRPAPAMETSAALLPAHPGRLPGLPSSRSDGDLGSSPSGASWAPSRPPGQPVRWRPRQLSFRRLLPAFQPSRPAGPMETSATIPPAHPGRSIAPGPSAQIRRRRARPPVFPRLPSALQASRPAGPVEPSPVTLPAHPGHRSGPLSGRSGGALARHPSSASCPPSRPPVQLRRRTPRQLSFRRILGAFQASRPAPATKSSPPLPGPCGRRTTGGYFFKRGGGGSKPRRQPSAPMSDFSDLRNF